MTTPPGRTAIIIGVSLGIGEALARELNREGWCLGLLAGRLDRLEALRDRLPSVPFSVAAKRTNIRLEGRGARIPPQEAAGGRGGAGGNVEEGWPEQSNVNRRPT